MTHRLNTYVHVHVDGETRVYGPGEDIPGPVAQLITAPDVWEGGTPADLPDVDPDASPTEAATGDTAPISSGVPPRGGKGSGIEAWKTYASDKGFEFDHDVTRDEIIAALNAEKIPTE